MAPSIDKAKLQVSIRQRIWQAHHEFVKRTQGYEKPNALYLGYEDYDDLRRECEISEFDFRQDVSYMGMNIYRVDEKRHLNVTHL